MAELIKVLCETEQDSIDFQAAAYPMGIMWGMNIEQPWNTDRKFLIIMENLITRGYYVITWATLDDFTNCLAPMVTAKEFIATKGSVFHRAVAQLERARAQAPHVAMPSEFVATKYPGYFWNTRTRTLFTAKLGVLRELQLITFNRWSNVGEPHYRVSHQGRKRILTVSALSKLKPGVSSTFPVEFTTIKGVGEMPVDISKLPPGTQLRIRIDQ